MASQSKFALPGRFNVNVRNVVLQLTQMYLANRSRISRAVWITLFVALVNRIRHAISEQKAASAREANQRAARRSTAKAIGEGGDETPRKKVALDREFFRALLRLVRIVVPGWRSKEMRLIISHSLFLVLRTLISLKVAEMDGAIVKALVKGNGKEFLTRILWWMLIAVPATFTNSMVRD
jgi:ATP-binding cassette subfamily D (ALD) long-chain fatty acid import protein